MSVKEWMTSGKPDQPDGIEDDTHDLPSIESAAERVNAWLEQFGDGLCSVEGGQPLYSRDLLALTTNVDTVHAIRKALAAVKRRLSETTLENERLCAGVECGRCLACPSDCNECAGADCGCYEHQDLHPEHLKAEADRLRSELEHANAELFDLKARSDG
jgi:hypothetical protein